MRKAVGACGAFLLELHPISEMHGDHADFLEEGRTPLAQLGGGAAERAARGGFGEVIVPPWRHNALMARSGQAGALAHGPGRELGLPLVFIATLTHLSPPACALCIHLTSEHQASA